MKTTSVSNPRILRCFALAAALAVAAPLFIHAADSTDPKSKMPGKMMAGCGEMMAHKKEMATAQRAQDTVLSTRVVAMNAAPAGQKAELMAAIVTSLVEQRAAQNVQAGKMQEKMMAHMMDHMAMGQDSMKSCPMMKGMDGMDGKSMQAHREQDQEKN